jgi:hypothetical protein
MGIMVSRKTVAKLMRAAGLAGIPRRQTRKNPKIEVRSEDLVNRNFLRTQPNLLWVCDITEHPTREGKVYCCAVLDAFSRKIVGWSIDNSQNTNLVVNALEMAISNRNPQPGTVFHSDHGVQGGFNWSSQHLDRGGVDGQASGVDESVDGQVGDEVAGGSVASTGRGAAVLARDRQRAHQRGSRERGRRVAGCRSPVVPGTWRHADVHARSAVGPVPVL